MKSNKLKKLLAMTMALVLLLSCAPSFTLPIFAAELSAADVAQEVQKLNYFDGSKKSEYEQWLIALQADETTYAAEIDRLQKAITSLTEEIDWYDDLTNLGANNQDASQQPANRFDPFLQSDGSATAPTTATWEILWGGLDAANKGENYMNAYQNYALPGTLDETNWANTLFFKPYHYTRWRSPLDTDKTDVWLDTASNILDLIASASSSYSYLQGAMNWATPVGAIHENQNIQAVSGSGRLAMAPAIIYDYVDSSNYAYVMIQNAHKDDKDGRRNAIKAVVVEDGMGREVTLWENESTMYLYQGLAGGDDVYSYIYDFDLTWSDTDGCYVFTVKYPKGFTQGGGNDVTKAQGLSASTYNDVTVSIKLKNDQSYGDILVHGSPAKLEKLYITAGYAGLISNSPAYSRIAIDYETVCPHTNKVNNEGSVCTPATCQSDAVYYVFCNDCNQYLEETWTKADSKVDHNIVYTSVSDTHHVGNCSYGCGETTGEQEHDYGPNGATPGAECLQCGHRYLETDLANALNAVDNRHVFLQSEMTQYREWLLTLEPVKSDEKYKAAYDRLTDAVNVLSTYGLTVYDDLLNVGQNYQDSQNTTGLNKMDPFPQQAGQTNEDASWEILWGGLNTTGTAYDYTLPNALKTGWENTLYFYPFANAQWNDGSKTWNLTSDENLSRLPSTDRATDSFKTILGGLNWATPVGSAHENVYVNSVVGSARMVMAPALIYEYIDANNYSYIMLDSRDNWEDAGGKTEVDRRTVIKAVVVKEGKGTEVVLLDPGTSWYAGWSLANSDLFTGVIYNFDLTWSEEDSCYIFTIEIPSFGTDEANALKEQGVGSASATPMHTFSFKLKNTETQTLLAGSTAKKLRKVYITTSTEAGWMNAAPAYSRIGAIYEEYHECDTNGPEIQISPATCESPAIWAKTCSHCGAAIETYEVGNPLDHESDGTWHHNNTNHWQVCKTCGVEMNSEKHFYGINGEQAGSACYTCDFIYGQDALNVALTFTNNIRVFKMSEIDTYVQHLQTLKSVRTVEPYDAAYARLLGGIAGLQRNGTYYDDLANLGTYQTTGEEPTEAWTPFATTEDTDSSWQIIWGGLKANMETYNNASNLLTYTNPMVFNPFHMNYYKTTNLINNTEYNAELSGWSIFTSAMDDNNLNNKYTGQEWGYYYSGDVEAPTTKVDLTTFMGGINWTTPTYLAGNTLPIERVTGTGNTRAMPAIIFDYVSPGNYSYLGWTAGNGGNSYILMKAVVVENYRAVREVTVCDLLGYTFYANYLMRGDGVLFDFEMVWSGDHYVLTIDMEDPEESTADKVPGATASDPQWHYEIHLDNRYEASIFSGDKTTATQLTSLYVSRDARKLYELKGLTFTNLGVTLTEAGHTHTFDQKVENNAHVMIESDCSQTGTYYYSCTCGLNGTETFYGSKLGTCVKTEEFAFDKTHHWHFCSVCYQQLHEKEEHYYVGDSNVCAVCGYKNIVEQEVNFLPVIMGGQVLKNAIATEQKLRLYVDFSALENAYDTTTGSNIKLVEYGYAVMSVPAGGVTKLQLETLVKNGGVGVVSVAYSDGALENGGLKYITVNVGAANYGTRVAMIAYTKDDQGNYYFSENNENTAGSNLNGSLINGMLQTGVMRVIKNTMTDNGAEGYGTYITAASEKYWQSTDVSDAVKNALGENATAADAEAMLRDYLTGTIGTNHKDYLIAREICLWVFYYVSKL